MKETCIEPVSHIMWEPTAIYNKTNNNHTRIHTHTRWLTAVYTPCGDVRKTCKEPVSRIMWKPTAINNKTNNNHTHTG